MRGRSPADDEGVDAANGEDVDAADGESGDQRSDGEGDGVSDDAVDVPDAVDAPVLERVPIRTQTADRSATGDAAECTVRLPDDLAGDLDDFCRRRYLHREDAIRVLLAEWLDGRAAE